MSNGICNIENLKTEFAKCQKLFTALGDETRQQLICIMLCEDCKGSRVIDIAKKIHLLRPAVSHHMQILKNTGLVKTRKEGTFIYYYLSPEDNDVGNMNQQKFMFSLDKNTVSAKAGIGFYTKLDLGIAKYHFEIGAGAENFRWK